jgi:hypothetical protein
MDVRKKTLEVLISSLKHFISDRDGLVFAFFYFFSILGKD